MTQPLPARPRSEAILARLAALHPKAIDLSLDRVARLLARLGDPQDALPPVVHVAGTNGKGSTVAFLRAMLEAAGYRVHAYISPHLVRFNERIRLAGRLIEDHYLEEMLERCERANRGEPITFFEITTATAFLAFRDTPADAVLLETGLGGRLDATNLVARPACTAITPISMDHMHFLGGTLAAIAAEKAGIIKPGAPCVLGPQLPEAAAVFAARADALAAPLDRCGVEWQATGEGRAMRWRGQGREIELPMPGLPGLHQVDNAGTAIACLNHLAMFDVPEAAIARGLTAVEWPARLQRLSRGPLASLAPPGARLWLDGGHNPGAGVALAETFAAWRKADTTPRKLYLVTGMLNTKDAAGFLAPLAAVASGAVAIAIPGEANSYSAEELRAFADQVGLPCQTAPNALGAVASVQRLAADDAVPPDILVCGSLYLAGHVLRDNA
jgi:dihydrofolate synthase / folylpolyglutamate synthase